MPYHNNVYTKHYSEQFECFINVFCYLKKGDFYGREIIRD